MSSIRHQWNIGFLGFPGSGKSTLFSYLQSSYGSKLIDKGTVKVFPLSEKNRDIKIWDLNYEILNSQRDFPDIIKDTILIFIVYDLTNAPSLDIGFYYRAICWLADVDCRIVLVGNKKDLKFERSIPESLGKDVRYYFGLDEQFEMSAIHSDGQKDFLGFFKKQMGIALASRLTEVKASDDQALARDQIVAEDCLKQYSRNLL